jgi:transglycosylase-like protein/putative Flp pilus-assembly TadE/G-like protein
MAATRAVAWCEERGQVAPVLVVVMFLLLVAGVIVFQLAAATSLATTAQTAADAAALAGEQEVVREEETPVVVDGVLQPPVIDPAQVAQKAEGYAESNDAHLVGDPQIVPTDWGNDVIVSVATNNGLEKGIDQGHVAHASARASNDPLSGSGTGVEVSNEASVSSGPRFVAHGGDVGFFPDPSANYSVGEEPEIAARLDRLGKAEGLHLEGLSGFRTPGHSVEVGGSANDPHTCGAASDTPGIEGVQESTLEQFGLTRPFPNLKGEADHIQLAGTDGSVCTTGSSVGVGAGAGVGIPGLGNPNVHLVPISGGPSGAFVSFGSLAASAGWAIPWAVVNCESGGRNTSPNSASASGFYQITAGTWGGFGGYPAAYLAPKSVQDAKALELYKTRGLHPWVSSEHCWGPIIGFQV